MKKQGIPFQTIDWASVPRTEHKGEATNELKDGSRSVLREGMSYIVSDDLSSHRSNIENGVHLLIIDGDFLRTNA